MKILQDLSIGTRILDETTISTRYPRESIYGHAHLPIYINIVARNAYRSQKSWLVC